MTADLNRMDRTWLCSVLFTDIVNYSSQSVDVQMKWKERFNGYLSEAIRDVPENERVILDTGDGAAVCFLGSPEAAMFAALDLWQRLKKDEREQPRLRVRTGVNLGPVKLVRDLNGRLNALGDGINVGQRIMSFAPENQILVSQSYFEVVSRLSDDYKALFKLKGMETDKHVREYMVYTLLPPESGKLVAAASGSHPPGTPPVLRDTATAPAHPVSGTPEERPQKRRPVLLLVGGALVIFLVTVVTWRFVGSAWTNTTRTVETGRLQSQALSGKEPSTNINSPTLLELNQVVNGRLGNSDETGKSHFWLMDFAPGKFKVVLDVRRADLNDSNIGGDIQSFSVDGQKLEFHCAMNQVDYRWREVCFLAAEKANRMILRYSNGFTVSDYWLGVFRADSPIRAPFFYQCPSVQQMKLGVEVSAALDGSQPSRKDAWYSMRLPAGDYKLSVNYVRSDNQKGNVGGKLSMYSQEGEYRSTANGSNEIDFSSKNVSNLALADDTEILFRLTAAFTRELVTLKIDQAKER